MHALIIYNYYCSYIVIHDYHKIILHAVESRSVNVPLIVATTVPSVVVVILASVIIVTFTIIVYKQLQKHSTNEGKNLYDVTNLSDVPSVPPGLSPSNAKFEINQNMAYEAQQFKSANNWDMNENEAYQKPPQHDYEQVELNSDTHTSDANYVEIVD